MFIVHYYSLNVYYVLIKKGSNSEKNPKGKNIADTHEIQVCARLYLYILCVCM